MPTDAERPTLNISVVGEGVAPDTLPTNELIALLRATSQLLKAVADEHGFAAPPIALTGVKHGSAAYDFAPVSRDEDPRFAPLVDLTYRAVRTRGKGLSRPVNAALERLYTACPTGSIEFGGRGDTGQLEKVLMAQPLAVAAPSIDASTTLYGKVTSVVSTRGEYQVTLKPRDGRARIELLTQNDLLAERAAQLFNQDVRLAARYALPVEGKRDTWELTAITAWKASPFLSVIDDVREHLAREGIQISSRRFEQSLLVDNDQDDA
jgi:hypothetical protein